MGQIAWSMAAAFRINAIAGPLSDLVVEPRPDLLRNTVTISARRRQTICVLIVGRERGFSALIGFLLGNSDFPPRLDRRLMGERRVSQPSARYMASAVDPGAKDLQGGILR